MSFKHRLTPLHVDSVWYWQKYSEILPALGVGTARMSGVAITAAAIASWGQCLKKPIENISNWEDKLS